MRPVAWKMRQALPQQALVEKVKSVGKKPVAMAAQESACRRRQKAILVDGNNVLYHFFRPSCTSERNGQRVGAIDGMIRLLRRLDAAHLPHHICVVFDHPQRSTVRKLVDPTYKSDRRPTPTHLREQLVSVSDILTHADINCIKAPGIEADDLIASYVEAYRARDYDVLLVSNDNDLLQLARGEQRTSAWLENDDGTGNSPAAAAAASVSLGAGVNDTTDQEAAVSTSACVEVYQLNKRRYLRERHVRSRFSVAPWQLPDYFALRGHLWGKTARVADVTDELAAELLAKYESLPKLLRHLDEIESTTMRKALKQSIGTLETSLRISKLNSHVPLPYALELLQAPRLERLPETSVSIV